MISSHIQDTRWVGVLTLCMDAVSAYSTATAEWAERKEKRQKKKNSILYYKFTKLPPIGAVKTPQFFARFHINFQELLDSCLRMF